MAPAARDDQELQDNMPAIAYTSAVLVQTASEFPYSAAALRLPVLVGPPTALEQVYWAFIQMYHTTTHQGLLKD
jgi:hypothetical protein